MQKQESELQNQQLDDLSDQIRSIGSWSFNQNLLYVIFLQKNKLVMISRKKRRNLRIFDQMAEFISTRNSLQCRSHHQKLLQKFGEVKNIISNFKKYVTKDQYKNKFQELFGKDKHKKDNENTCYQVKQEPLSQQCHQILPSAQQKPARAAQATAEQLQVFYQQYLAQLSRQLVQFPLLGYYYSGLQNLS